jgi:hypothetical protein
MQPPDKFNDGSRLGGWLNKLLAFCRESRVVAGAGYLVSHTTRGTVLEITGGKGGGSRVQQFRLVSIQNDFYTCVSWDGTTAGTQEIYIARPFEHRVSNFNGRTIDYSSDGDSFSASYSYESATKRTKTIGSTVETQVLYPLFKTGFTEIYAMEVGFPITVGASHTPLTDPNDDPITLLEWQSERAWTKIA